MKNLPEELRLRQVKTWCGWDAEGEIYHFDVPLYPADILIDYERMVVIKRVVGEYGHISYTVSEYPPSHHID